MKEFNKLSEVGRGRLLYTTEVEDQTYKLYRATTNEYILLCRGEEIILPSQADAIKWAVDHNLCHSKEEFLGRCTEVVRIPWQSVIPEVRPYCDGEVELESPVDPDLRIEELIQHPAFNTCIAQHAHGEEVIRLTETQRKRVIRYVRRMFDGNYSFKKRVHLSENIHVRRADSSGEPNIHKFSLFFASLCKSQTASSKKKRRVKTNMETFVAFAGKNLPYYFDRRDCDEVTWLKINGKGSYSQKSLNRCAIIAIAVNLYIQVDYEYLWSPAMYPLEILQDLGILPYEDPQPHDF